MDARDKLKKAKTLGKTTVSKDGKTKTTTNKGWSITSGVQKKTVAPKHKASPKPTTGRSIKYHGGKSNVVDLGHNPTKSAISTATTKLRKASKVAKPKATKHSTASVPTVKVPQVGAPTVPTSTPDTKPNTSSNTAGKVAALGVTIAGAAGVAALALKKASAPNAKAKPPRPGGDPKQLRLPGAEKKLPAPLKGLPGPDKGAKRAVLDQAHKRAAALVPKTPKVTAPKTPTVAEQHTARRAKQGAALKSAFGAAARADARAAGPPKATVKAGGKTLEAASIVDQRPKQIVSSKMDAEGKRTTKVLRGEGMEKVLAEADKRVGEERRLGARRDQSTRPKKPNDLAAPKQSTRRKAGQRRAPGVAAVTPPKTPSAAGFGASEADIQKVATSGEKVKAPTIARVAANKAKIAEAPKEVRDMVSDIEKAKAPKVGRFPTHPTMGGLAADQKGKVKAPLKGVAPPVHTLDEKVQPKVPEAPRPAEIPTVKAGGTDAQAVYKEAREAMRSGDASRMKTIVGRLPTGTKKTEKYAKNLEAGIQAAGNRPPTATPAPKIEAPEVPKAPKPVNTTADQPKVGRLDGAPAEPKVDPAIKKELDAERAKNVKLKAAQPADQAMVDAELKEAKARAPAKPAKVEAPAEPMRGVTEGETRAAAGNLRGVAVESVEPTKAQVDRSRKTSTDKDFYKKRSKARRAANKQAIEAKGLATIPTDPTEVTSEEALVKQKVAERNLMDAVAKAEGSGPKPAPKAVGAEGDKRTATDLFGKEAVAEKTRVIDMVPPDLETEHGGGRQRGTMADIINQDQDARGARGEEVRRAAAKARNIAASRNASPAQMEGLERAVDAEYDKGLEMFYDDAEPHNQRGPRKADAPPRLLDPMIDAEFELAEARGSAMPPAPADRTTLNQKIAEVQKRIAVGGDSIYKGKDTLRMLENLRDQGTAEVTAPKRTAAMPPTADLVREQYAKDRPSTQRAKRAGEVAGETAAKAKRVSGKPGPVKVPDMTKPGAIPAGPITAPATPAVEHGRVQGPPKTMSQLWAGRMADWGRSMYQAQVKRLTSPMLDVAGEKAKTTGTAEARAKASKLGTVGKVGGTLGLATLAFAGLGAGEAAAKESDPSKRGAAAGKQFKADLPEVGKGILKFTAADYGVTKVVPSIIKKAATTLGANATRSAFAAGLGATVGRLGLAGYIGYHALPFTGKKLAELAHSAVEAKKAGGAATAEKKASEAKYGTVELATKTRHAKEALKRKQAADKKGKK